MTGVDISALATVAVSSNVQQRLSGRYNLIDTYAGLYQLNGRGDDDWAVTARCLCQWSRNHRVVWINWFILPDILGNAAIIIL
jgi:hypothetical protein